MKKQTTKLRTHVFSTYVNLRIGIAIFGAALPIILYVIGKTQGISLQQSISSYFHADPDGYLLRAVFVGLLFATGTALYMYKGYSDWENNALNLAGLFIIGVAIFPMTWLSPDGSEVLFQGIELFHFGKYEITLHGLCAVLFFLCIAFVCIKCAPETLELLNDKDKIKRYKRTYLSLGIAMIGFPIGAAIMAVAFQSKVVFWVEIAGIAAFVIYWLVKSFEILSTNERQKDFFELELGSLGSKV